MKKTILTLIAILAIVVGVGYAYTPGGRGPANEIDPHPWVYGHYCGGPGYGHMWDYPSRLWHRGWHHRWLDQQDQTPYKVNPKGDEGR